MHVLHHPRPCRDHRCPRRVGSRGVIHPKTAGQGSRALRQETRRGGGGNRDRSDRERPRPSDCRNRRSAVSPAGASEIARRDPAGGRSGTGTTHRRLGVAGKGGAQARLKRGRDIPMDIRVDQQQYNPYRVFTREQWAKLRDDTPMTLEPGEFERLRSLHDRLDLKEVEDIYLPLSRLLSIYVDATTRLFQAQRQFLGIRGRKVPYIIGIAGSVAGGKSTTARVLQALLARWSPRPKVDLVTTDGFLHPNAVLERLGLIQKKGFPASYDLPLLLSFLSDIKAGRRGVRAPVYSHLSWDIVPNQWQEVDQPDILIVEGVNVLQTGRLPRDGKAVAVVSDFF